MIKTLWYCWLVAYLSIKTLLGYGQCPDPKTVYQQIKQVFTKPDSTWVEKLNRLKNEYRTCRLAPDSNYARILFGLGYALSINQQFYQANQLTQESIAINNSGRKNVKRSELCKYYNYVGYYLMSLSKNIDAIEAYQKSVQFSRNGTDNNMLGKSFENLAFLYSNQGDYQKAINCADLGYSYCQSVNDTLGMSICLYESAKVESKLKRFSSAEKQIRQAIQLINDIPDATSKKNSYKSTLAELLFLNQKPAEGLKLYQELIQVYQQQKTKNEAAVVYNDVGYQYLSTLKIYSKSLHYFNLAYQYFADPTEKANTLSNIALVYAEQKKYLQALNFLQKSLTTFPIGFANVKITVNPTLSELRTAPYKEKLLSIIQAKADVWLNYARTSASRQYLLEALATYNTADHLIDIMRWEHTGQQSKIFWREKTRSIYENAIETCYRLGNMEQAFRFMEKSRAVLLTDKLNESGAQQQLSPNQVIGEQRLHQRVNDQQNKLAALTPDSIQFAPARMALLTSQDSLNGFLKQLEVSNPAYYQIKYDNATPSLAALQQYLNGHQSTLVTYFVGDSALYVLAVMKSGAFLHKQPVGSYNQTLRQFAPLLAHTEALRTTTNVNWFLTLSNQLYTQLLAPLKLPKGRVIVSPDGFFIPFDALSRSASQAQYVLDDYAFSYVYSASLLFKKREKNRQLFGFGGRDFLGVAPVNFAPALHQVMLPNSDTALEPIAGRFGSSVLLTYKAATRRAFLTQAANAQIIHLFTHAVADSTQQEPRLYFADSTLQLADLEDGALPQAQLVVLAACKTGIGANQRGEGVFSLARGFAALGVPSVLTTLWSVENEATYKLTDLFYQYLDQGLPKDVALQKAKQDWYQSGEGGSQLPTYWAGLIIVGDAEPLSQTHYRWWLAGGGLLLIGGLGGWWFRRRRQAAHLRL